MCEFLRADILRALSLCDKERREKKKLKKEREKASVNQTKSSAGEKWGNMFHFWDIAEAVERLRGMETKISFCILNKEIDSMIEEGILLTAIDHSPGHLPYQVFERR